MDLAEQGRYRLEVQRRGVGTVGHENVTVDFFVAVADEHAVELGRADSTDALTVAAYLTQALNAAFDAGHKAAIQRVEDVLLGPCDCGACVPLEKTDRDPATFLGNERCNRPVNDAAAAMRGGGA